jgi:hypothetical protein
MCVAVFVVGWFVLAAVSFSDGAWVRGLLSAMIATGFAVGVSANLRTGHT